MPLHHAVQRAEESHRRLARLRIEQLQVVFLFCLILRHELRRRLVLRLQQLLAHDNLQRVQTLHRVALHRTGGNLLNNRQVLPLQGKVSAQRVHPRRLHYQLLAYALAVPGQDIADRRVDNQHRQQPYR